MSKQSTFRIETFDKPQPKQHGTIRLDNRTISLMSNKHLRVRQSLWQIQLRARRLHVAACTQINFQAQNVVCPGTRSLSNAVTWISQAMIMLSDLLERMVHATV